MLHHFDNQVVFEERDAFDSLIVCDLLGEYRDCVELLLLITFVASYPSEGDRQIFIYVPIFIVNYVVTVRKVFSIHIAKLLIKVLVGLEHLQVLEYLFFQRLLFFFFCLHCHWLHLWEVGFAWRKYGFGWSGFVKFSGEEIDVHLFD